jgi:hypothetical protein
MSTVLAHAGHTHWYVSLLYAAPVFVLVALLGIAAWRERRRRRRGDDPT